MACVSLTAVIVAHNSLRDLRRTLPPLLAELGPQDEVIVVDNASSDGLAVELGQLAPAVRLVNLPENLGFAGGVNAGAAASDGDLLVLLNPDARVQPGWSKAIREPWGGAWGAWMGLVLLEDEHRINTSGGILHFAGFGWAGQVGQPRQDAPHEPTEVGFLSGACLAIPRQRWTQLGGFSEQFFMYCEDVDLSLRLRLIGGSLAVIPDAAVAHDYEFGKGSLKWRLLEANRWAMMIRTYPGPLLAAVAPALIVTEVVVWAVALRGGWGRMKLLATVDLFRRLPRLLAERRVIRSKTCIPAIEFAAHLTSTLDSPYFGSVGTRPLLRSVMSLYWKIVLRALSRGRGPAPDAHPRSAS